MISGKVGLLSREVEEGDSDASAGSSQPLPPAGGHVALYRIWISQLSLVPSFLLSPLHGVLNPWLLFKSLDN